MDQKTAETLANYGIDDTVRVVTAKIDSDKVRVRLTTTAHQMDRAYRLLVQNIRDIAAQPNAMSAAASVRYFISHGMSVSDQGVKPF